MAKLQCSKRVFHKDGAFGEDYPCESSGVVIRSDGGLWCSQHDPEAVAKRRNAQQAKWDAKFNPLQMEKEARAEEAAARAALCVAACEGVTDEVLESLTPGELTAIVKRHLRRELLEQAADG